MYYESRLIGLPESVIDKLKSDVKSLTLEEQELLNQYPIPSHYSV